MHGGPITQTALKTPRTRPKFRHDPRHETREKTIYFLTVARVISNRLLSGFYLTFKQRNWSHLVPPNMKPWDLMQWNRVTPLLVDISSLLCCRCAQWTVPSRRLPGTYYVYASEPVGCKYALTDYCCVATYLHTSSCLPTRISAWPFSYCSVSCALVLLTPLRVRYHTLVYYRTPRIWIYWETQVLMIQAEFHTRYFVPGEGWFRRQFIQCRSFSWIHIFHVFLHPGFNIFLFFLYANPAWLFY